MKLPIAVIGLLLVGCAPPQSLTEGATGEIVVREIGAAASGRYPLAGVGEGGAGGCRVTVNGSVPGCFWYGQPSGICGYRSPGCDVSPATGAAP